MSATERVGLVGLIGAATMLAFLAHETYRDIHLELR